MARGLPCLHYCELDSMTNKEIWRKIPHLKGYLVSSHGRVRGLRKRTMKIFIGSKGTRGYRRAFILGESRSIHRLVLITFIGPQPSKKHEALHLDNNTSNNLLSNLRWGTHEENMYMDRGRNHSHRGEKNPNAKLTTKQVSIIRQAYQRRKSCHWGMTSLAKELKISNKQILLIAKKQYGGWKE